MTVRLRGTERFSSTNLDYTRDAVARSLCPHTLKLVKRHGILKARMVSHRLRNISFNEISYGDDVHIDPGELGSFYVLQVPLSGHAALRCGTQQVQTMPGQGSAPTPTQPLRMRWSADCAQMVVRIERPALETHLRDLLGHSLPRPINFDLGVDLTTGHGRVLHGGVAFAVSQLSHDHRAFADSRLAVATMEQGLMTGLLLAARSNYSGMLNGDAPLAPSRLVSDVIDLVESHPEWAHTAATLARDQGVSVRTLERAFRHHLDSSPMTYLREVRLRRAHDELYAAAPDTTSVTEVAGHWGFINLGRFAKFYQDQFGETPSHTLRC